MTRLYTASETAAFLHITPHGVRKMAREGRIPAHRVGGQWRFDINEISKETLGRSHERTTGEVVRQVCG